MAHTDITKLPVIKRRNQKVFIFGRWFNTSDKVYQWFKKKMKRWKPGRIRISTEIYSEVKDDSTDY